MPKPDEAPNPCTLHIVRWRVQAAQKHKIFAIHLENNASIATAHLPSLLDFIRYEYMMDPLHWFLRFLFSIIIYYIFSIFCLTLFRVRSQSLAIEIKTHFFQNKLNVRGSSQPSTHITQKVVQPHLWRIRLTKLCRTENDRWLSNQPKTTKNVCPSFERSAVFLSTPHPPPLFHPFHLCVRVSVCVWMCIHN